MTGVVLVWAGVFLAFWGAWRGYGAARAALVPLLRDGDPTRSLVDATRPVHARVRVRLAARNVVTAVAWLGIAMYGMYLATVGDGGVVVTAPADRVAGVLERYEPVIGIEIHCQLRTASKMFCGCSTAYADAAPNTHVCPVCLALPGSLPVVNRRAVELVIATGLAIDAVIPERTQWERKNYFYPDLPKGYQISQYAIPLAARGPAGDRDLGRAVQRADHPGAPRGGHGEADPRGRRRTWPTAGPRWWTSTGPAPRSWRS